MIESKYIWDIDSVKVIDNKNDQLNDVVLQILQKRGIETPEDIDRFLNPKLCNLYDPTLMKDMDKAVQRIRKAIKDNEKVTIYGDYDVDGITSCTIMMKLLQKFGLNVDYYVPSRIDEGYGLNKKAIEEIHKRGTTLIITVDNGISSFNEVEFAKKLGIDVIITDHHEPRNKLPNAFAILNPKQPDCRYPFKELAGVGVVLKLAYALLDADISEIEEYLDLAALGTVADIVPLLDENRIIVKNGLQKLNTTTNKGINALKNILNLQGKPIDTGKIGFMIAPRLNAVGRISDASIAIELLLTNDIHKARQLAEVLEDINRKRQNIENKIFNQAKEFIENNLDLELNKVIVLSSSNWHPGVIGIVASKITEMYNRPSILISVKGETGQGSGRSIQGFNLFKALDKNSDLLIRYGGHEQAAGLTINVKNIDKFTKNINMLAQDILKKSDLTPRLAIDLELKEDINLDLAKQLELLEPFGYKNPKPLFVSKNLFLEEVRTVGKKDRHLKMKLRKKKNKIDSIGFNLGNMRQELEMASIVDLAFYLEVNRWNGYVTPQLNIKDVKIPYLYDAMLCYIEDKYYSNFHISLKNNYECFQKSISEYKKYNSINVVAEEKRKNNYIKEVLEKDRKILFLINTPYGAWKLINYFKKHNLDRDCVNISFSHEINSDKRNNIIVQINPLATLKNTNFDDVIFYDTPFSIHILDGQLKQINEKCKVHFLFSKDDLRFNLLTCLKILPDVEDIRKSYVLFRKMTSNKFVGKINIREFNSFLRNCFNVNIHLLGVINIFKIFSEIGIIKFEIENDSINVTDYIKPEKKLDLRTSNTYVNLIKLRQEVLNFDKKFKDIISCFTDISDQSVV